MQFCSAVIIFLNCWISSGHSPGQPILILILQHKLQKAENSVGSFWTQLKPLGKKEGKKNLFLWTQNLWTPQLIYSVVSLSVREQLHCQFVKEYTHFTELKDSYKLPMWWGSVSTSEHNLEKFNSAWKNVKSQIMIFKLIKLQTVDSYEYSKHLKSAYQREIRRSTCFILMLLKTSITLLGYKHGNKAIQQNSLGGSIKEEKNCVSGLILIGSSPTKTIW